MSVSVKEDPLHVPILKADGSNWIMYRHKIELVVKLRELLGYLNGKTNQPIDPSIGKDAKWTPTAPEQKALDAYPEKGKKKMHGYKPSSAGVVPTRSVCE